MHLYKKNNKNFHRIKYKKVSHSKWHVTVGRRGRSAYPQLGKVPSMHGKLNLGHALALAPSTTSASSCKASNSYLDLFPPNELPSTSRKNNSSWAYFRLT